MIRSNRMFVIPFLLVLIFLSAAYAQFRNGNDHLGVYSVSSVGNAPNLKWKFAANGAVRSSPSLSGSDIVFGSSDGSCYCLSMEGKERWKFIADGPVSSSPAIDHGTVYFSSRANTIYAVAMKTGTVVWKKSLGTPLPYEWGFDYYVSSPSVDHENIYIGSADGYMYSLNRKNGKQQWTFNTGSVIRSTPAVDSDNVYFGNCAGKIYSLDKSTGTLQWEFSSAGDTLIN